MPSVGSPISFHEGSTDADRFAVWGQPAGLNAPAAAQAEKAALTAARAASSPDDESLVRISIGVCWPAATSCDPPTIVWLERASIWWWTGNTARVTVSPPARWCAGHRAPSYQCHSGPSPSGRIELRRHAADRMDDLLNGRERSLQSGVDREPARCGCLMRPRV